MREVLFITHPEVAIDPGTPVPSWSLSALGRERMERFAGALGDHGIAALWSSEERKAVEAAEIVARRLALELRRDERLGENDRSATGYLPRERFEALADRFFAEPGHSVEGWERAVDAQARIVRAVDHVLSRSPGEGAVAVVAHGGVGTLLLCALLGVPISRSHDQPAQGHWFSFACSGAERRVLHGWRRFG
jgi:broad specificity phosphatase PhoE